MAAIEFIVEDDQLKLSPQVLLVYEFKKLYEADTSPNKQNALMDLLWVHYMFQEEGSFTLYEGAEKEYNVNLAVYNTNTPKLDSNRLQHRALAAERYIFLEETIEGGQVQLMNSRLLIIQRAMKQGVKTEFKDDKEMDDYLNRSADQAEKFNKLLKSKNELLKAIAEQGGKKKINNVAGAATSPNEAGVYNRDAIERRRAQKAANEQG